MSRTPSRKPRVATVTPQPGVGGVPFVLRADDLMARYRDLHEETQAALRGLSLDRLAPALRALWLAEEAFRVAVAIGCGSEAAVARIRKMSTNLAHRAANVSPIRLLYQALRVVADHAHDVDGGDIGYAVQITFVGEVVKHSPMDYGAPPVEHCKAVFLWLTDRPAAHAYCDGLWPEKRFRAEPDLVRFVSETSGWDKNVPEKSIAEHKRLGWRPQR